MSMRKFRAILVVGAIMAAASLTATAAAADAPAMPDFGAGYTSSSPA